MWDESEIRAFKLSKMKSGIHTLLSVFQIFLVKDCNFHESNIKILWLFKIQETQGWSDKEITLLWYCVYKVQENGYFFRGRNSLQIVLSPFRKRSLLYKERICSQLGPYYSPLKYRPPFQSVQSEKRSTQNGNKLLPLGANSSFPSRTLLDRGWCAEKQQPEK